VGGPMILPAWSRRWEQTAWIRKLHIGARRSKQSYSLSFQVHRVSKNKYKGGVRANKALQIDSSDLLRG